MAESSIKYTVLDGRRLREAAAHENLFPGLQSLLAEAVEDGVPDFDEQAARSFARLNDPEGFKTTRIDPNKDVGTGLRDRQSLRNSAIVLAHDDDTLVGYAHGANTVSGGRLAQLVKRRGHSHQFTQIRDFAVKPSHQRRHIGVGLLYRTMQAIDPNLKNPVSGYVIAKATGVNALIGAVSIAHDVYPAETLQTPDGLTAYDVHRMVSYQTELMFTLAHGIANADLT